MCIRDRLQIVHLAGQGEQGTARPVGVSLVDIDIRLGIHPVEGWHRRGVVIVAVGCLLYTSPVPARYRISPRRRAGHSFRSLPRAANQSTSSRSSRPQG